MIKLKENSQICSQWCVCGGKEQELKIKRKRRGPIEFALQHG